MKRSNAVALNENGSVILIVTLVLIAVSALALTAVNFTTTEVNMAGNYKFDKTAFANGDSGINGTAPFINTLLRVNDAIDAQDPTRAGCIQFLNTTSANPANEIRDRIFGYKETPDATAGFNNPDQEALPAAADISTGGCNIPADINIEPAPHAQGMSGGGVEFGAGAEGIGFGGSSGIARVFRLVSTGTDQQNTSHTIRSLYRWVDVAGGN